MRRNAQGTQVDINTREKKTEGNIMSLIGKEVSDFNVKAFVNGQFKDVSKEDLLGK